MPTPRPFLTEHPAPIPLLSSRMRAFTFVSETHLSCVSSHSDPATGLLNSTRWTFTGIALRIKVCNNLSEYTLQYSHSFSFCELHPQTLLTYSERFSVFSTHRCNYLGYFLLSLRQNKQLPRPESHKFFFGFSQDKSK